MKQFNPFTTLVGKNTKDSNKSGPALKNWANSRWARTSLIIISCVATILGIGLANFGWGTNSTITYLSILALPLVLIRSRVSGLILFMFFINLGLARGNIFFANLSQFNNLYDQEVLIIGTVSDDPVIKDNRQTEFHVGNLQLLDDGSKLVLPGRLRVRGFPASKLDRGNIVQIAGKLRRALGNRQGQVSFAEITLLARSKNAVETVRQTFVAGTYSALPEPQASLGLGFLIGTRSLLPGALAIPMATIGLTHIVAVSGYNLTILVRFTRRFFGKISKYLAVASSFGLIAGFIAITGLSPSIVRAALVSVLALLAWYYGRPIKPLVLVFLPAAVTGYINPTYIWYDIGWYLSFLAFFGILIIAPLIYGRVYKNKKIPTLGQILIETTSAQLMTLPLIMFIFGQVSPFALPANMVVLPIVPLAMLTTFIAGLAGALIPSIAGWLAWPASIILKLITDLIQWLGGLPGAGVDFKISLAHTIILYICIIVVTIIMTIKNKNKKLENYSVVE